MSDQSANHDTSTVEWEREWAQRVVLRRITALASEHYILRGGVLTKHWLGGAARPTLDLDFVATRPFDELVAIEQLRSRLCKPPFEDEATISREHINYEVTWAETASPGLKIHVLIFGSGLAVQQSADIGFHDPIVPPPELIKMRIHVGPPVAVWAARRETGFAWKFHELFEKESWHSKHLYDLYAMIRHCKMEEEMLIPAIRASFESRGTPIGKIERLLSGDFAQSSSRRRKWPKFCRKYPQLNIPQDRFVLVRELVDFIKPLWDHLR